MKRKPERRLKTHYVTLRLKFSTAHTAKDAFRFANQSLGGTRHRIAGVRVRQDEDNGDFMVDRVVPA